MNSIPILIVVLLTLYVGFAQLDQISVQLGFYSPLFAATVTGLLMGDVGMGLKVGATMQLMTLGVATYGGATVPDFLSGSIMGTAFAIMSGHRAGGAHRTAAHSAGRVRAHGQRHLPAPG